MGADESVLRAARVGPAAVDLDFAAWVAPHTGALSAIAVREVGLDAAQDVVQEALVRAWRRRSTYRANRGSVRSWLVAVLLDQTRRHRVRWRSTLTVLAHPAEHPISQVTDRLTLDAAIASLAKRQREVITLHYLADLPVAEIASLLKISDGSVKSALHDARSALRRHLEES